MVWGPILSGLGKAALGGVGTAIGAGVAHQVGGLFKSGNKRMDEARARDHHAYWRKSRVNPLEDYKGTRQHGTRFAYTREQERAHQSMDLASQFKSFSAAGLTPQEAVGATGPTPQVGSSAAAGEAAKANAAVSAKNAETQARALDAQIQNNMANQQLGAARIQTDAQIARERMMNEADINRERIGGSLRQAEISAAVGHGANANTLRRIEMEAKKLPHEVQKAINAAASSHPDFVRELKTASMSAPNVVVSAILSKYGIKPEQIVTGKIDLSFSQRERLLSELIGAGSYVGREVKGTASVISEGMLGVQNWLKGN